MKLIRYNERIHNTNPDFSLTYKGNDKVNVFNEKTDTDLGIHHISRIKSNFNLSDKQIKDLKKGGTINYKVVGKWVK